MAKRPYLPFDSPDEPGVMLVPLTQNKYAKIDAADADTVSQYKWCAAKVTTKEWRELFYAMSRTHKPKKTIYLHRIVMDPPKGMEIDHENGDTLDCTRTNMRIATPGENQCNRRSAIGSTSQYLGVCWDSRAQKWRADIKKNRQRTWLGYFADEIEAAKAYDAKAREIHGDFARCNFA